MMRYARTAIRVAVLLGGFAATGTCAATVSLDITGTCSFGCSNVGLADGDAIGGTIDVDDTFYSQDGFSKNEALESYSFSFGNFSVANTDKPDPAFRVGWGNTPGSIFNVSLDAFLSNDPSNPAPLLIIFALSDFAGNGFASHDGWSREIPGCCIETNLGNVASLSLNPIDVAPIPLPAGGLLFLGALAAVAGLGIRRRSS